MWRRVVMWVLAGTVFAHHAGAFDPRSSAGTYVLPPKSSSGDATVTVKFRRDRDDPKDWRADGVMESRHANCTVRFTGGLVTPEKDGSLLVWTRFASFRLKGDGLAWQRNKTGFLSKWDKSSNRPRPLTPAPQSARTDPTWFAGDYSYNFSDSDDDAFVSLHFRRLRGRPPDTLSGWSADATTRDGIRNISVTFTGASVAATRDGGILVDAQFVGFAIDQHDLTWRPEFGRNLVRQSPK